MHFESMCVLQQEALIFVTKLSSLLTVPNGSVFKMSSVGSNLGFVVPLSESYLNQRQVEKKLLNTSRP